MGLRPFSYLHTLHSRPAPPRAYNLVSQNQWLLYDSGKLFPVTVSHVQIGVAHAADFYLNQDFVRRRFRSRHVPSTKGDLNAAERRPSSRSSI